ncbi:MAG: CvpA family protein [Bryobacter sp.]|jgi:membrane protein required for colicin V production|nr:CvpA family protein [Bryobacter sp. CoA8 C33]
MNWLDLVLAVILGVSVGTGVWKGFFRLSIGLAATVVSILAAMWFYGIAATLFTPYLKQEQLANFLGFLVILVGVQTAGVLLAKLLAHFFKQAGLGWVDRTLGGVFGLVRAVLIGSVVVLMLTAFSWTAFPTAVGESRLAPYVMEGARILVYLTPREIRDGFNENYEKIKETWKKTVKDTWKKAPELLEQ